MDKRKKLYAAKPDQTKPKRLYRSRIFEMIFSDKTELLKLYNAMNGTNYKDTELLEVNTLENAIYMTMRNDVSFILDSRMNLYEHQSTISPNLPLRFLFYVSDLYCVQTAKENLYGTKMIKIPMPKFVIFYNGEEEQPDIQYLKLSDMYSVRDGDRSLELVAVMLNINPGHNEELLKSCKTLRDYSAYTAKVRSYAKKLGLEAAVERAIDECIADGILADFLRENRAEAKSVSIYEYDEERHMRQEREASREEGFLQGRAEGRTEGIAKSMELNKLLLQAGRLDDLKRAAEDEKFCLSLYEEFHILL